MFRLLYHAKIAQRTTIFHCCQNCVLVNIFAPGIFKLIKFAQLYQAMIDVGIKIYTELKKYISAVCQFIFDGLSCLVGQFINKVGRYSYYRKESFLLNH